MEHASVIVTGLTMIGGIVAFIVSTHLLILQMKNDQEWNRKKTSEEILSQTIIGEFPKLMDTLLLEYHWDVLAHVPYRDAIAEMAAQDVIRLEIIARNILRHLEVISINMKHDIVDEKVCHEYLNSIMTTFYTLQGIYRKRAYSP